MDYKRIEIKSLGIGLLDITNLDLTKDDFIKTYLAVGQIKSSNLNSSTNSKDIKYNFCVTEKAIGINVSRNQINSDNDNSFIINGNIKCTGSIVADNIILDNPNINLLSQNMKDFNEILNRISSHLYFYNVKNYLDDNIYTNFNIVVGNQNDAANNKSPLKISRYANNYYSNIQFVIDNQDITNNDEVSRISIGIIGNDYDSPAHIITSPQKPLHFNISKDVNDLDFIYGNGDYRTPNYLNTTYPSLTLDTSNSVLINLDKFDSQIIYDKYRYTLQGFTIVTKEKVKPQLYVNGVLYADTILMYDYISESPINLDSLFMRKSDRNASVDVSKLTGTNFNKNEYKFNSNITIGDNNNNYRLKIYGNIQTTETIYTSDLFINNQLIVNQTSEFKNDCFFSGTSHFASINCANDISSKNLNLTGDIIYKGQLLTLDISPTNNTNILTVPASVNKYIIGDNLIVGGQTSGITDPTYGGEMINLYKYRESQKNQFEIYLNSYDSKTYIGHQELPLLNGIIDNSLIILNEYDTNWNNIYFYSGKKKNNLQTLIPNLAIMENDRIGINTKNPEKTLDINGDIISSNYYTRTNTSNYKSYLPLFYNNYNNLNNLNINFNDNFNDNNYLNLKQLNVIGGINSFNGYYLNDKELEVIKKVDSNNSIIENTNLGLNIQVNNSRITMPLQIRNNNTNNNKINNSVLVFYKSKDNSKYSGIEFCDDATNNLTVNNNKWYIYKNHITDDINFVGPLNIGYMNNSYKPSKSCINIYYSKNDKYFIDINSDVNYNSDNEYNNNKETVRINGSVKINGDIDVNGSINITGNYKFNDNNILFSPNPVQSIINRIYSLGNNIYYFDTILSSNHPKKISFNNKYLSLDVYSNIKYDTIPANITNDINNTSNNLIVSYSNYYITSNNITNIQILSNNFIKALNTSNSIIASYNYNDNSQTNVIITNSRDNYLLASNLYNNNTNISSYSNISINNYINNLNTSNRISVNTNYLNTSISISNIAVDNKNLNTNLSNIYNNYNNDINNIINNSNVYDKYYLNLSNLNITNIDFYNSNNELFKLSNSRPYNQLYNSSNIIYNNISNIKNNSSNINLISQDIYNSLSNTGIIINNYSNIINNYSNISYLSNQKILNSNSVIINNYNSLSNVLDIKNIILCANNNQSISSNIYLSTSNFYNYLNNLNIVIKNYSNISYNDYLISSNLSNICYNYNITNNNQKLLLSNSLISNVIYSSNIYLVTSNIYNNIIDNYINLYDNITINYNNNTNIYNLNISQINKNVISTSRIVNSINTNLNNYLASSLINITNSSNLDNSISSFNIDIGEKLTYYDNISGTNGIGLGIGKIITNIGNELEKFQNYKNELLALSDNYSFIKDYEIINNNYNNVINQINFCINLLTELSTDINNINTIKIINNNDLIILLELVLHITNKYINFINNSYDFASVVSQIAQSLSIHISTFMTTSLTEIPLLMTLIEYANKYLKECWEEISIRIVDYASLSYSLNSLIGSDDNINNINQNQQGLNTDVMIIGNNMKYYPNNSIFIGHENDYSRWLESTLAADININDKYKSLLYLYNYNPNSTICSFNNRSQKFISTPQTLILKSSSAIDINLIDTAQKTYQDSIIDGVSLRLSHIFKRNDLTTITPSSNNSLFEVVRKKNDTNPYFSCYTTNDDKNIMNVGSGIFYDLNNYNCLNENVVLHINENTSRYLLKLTNNSDNPLLVGFNKWDFIFNNNNFNITSNNLNILNLSSNKSQLNSSLSVINSNTNTNSGLEIINDYSQNQSQNQSQITESLNVYNSFDILYNTTGLNYIKKPNIYNDYDVIYEKFNINKNIITSNIQTSLSNVIMNYGNINNTNNFNYYYNNNSNIVDLLPRIDNIDPNIIITNNSYIYYSKDFYVSINNILTPVTIYYKTCKDAINVQSTVTNKDDSQQTITINTNIHHELATNLTQDYTTITINYQITVESVIYTVTNIISYYNYLNFTVPSIDIEIISYKYNLLRLNNNIPNTIYNSYVYTTTSNLNNINRIITIDNNLDYLNPAIQYTNNNTYSEQKKIKYPIRLFKTDYYISLNYIITDTYKTISITNDNLNINFINNSIKKPSISLKTIDNNYHNIYSFKDNYEIYYNTNKLINIDKNGSLVTSGDISTNNIFINGDIYNSDGKSLFNNINTLFNNINIDFQINTQKNILLNPSTNKDRTVNKSGVHINAISINENNNNLFQINNFQDNDNLITLNSMNNNSYIHFITNENQTNLIYKFGVSSGSFGIWKRKDNISPYNNNYFIDTYNSDSTIYYNNALIITQNPNSTTFTATLNGTWTNTSDRRLKTNIQKIDNALNKVCELEGITYKMIGDNNKNTGLIAQDVYKVLPEAVSIGEDGFYNLAYGNMMGLIVEAIKELKEEIRIIKTKF